MVNKNWQWLDLNRGSLKCDILSYWCCYCCCYVVVGPYGAVLVLLLLYWCCCCCAGIITYADVGVAAAIVTYAGTGIVAVAASAVVIVGKDDEGTLWESHLVREIVTGAWWWATEAGKRERS